MKFGLIVLFSLFNSASFAQAMVQNPSGTFTALKVVELSYANRSPVECQKLQARYIEAANGFAAHCETDAFDRVTVTSFDRHFEVSFLTQGRDLNTCQFSGNAVFDDRTQSLLLKLKASPHAGTCELQLHYSADFNQLSAQASPNCKHYCGPGAPLEILSALRD